MGSWLKAWQYQLSIFPCGVQVFYGGNKKAIFFVASRGHHADIGGITPGNLPISHTIPPHITLRTSFPPPTHTQGSMPPNSKHLSEEGMCVKSFKIVQNGIFQEDGKRIEADMGGWVDS